MWDKLCKETSGLADSARKSGMPGWVVNKWVVSGITEGSSPAPHTHTHKQKKRLSHDMQPCGSRQQLGSGWSGDTPCAAHRRRTGRGGTKVMPGAHGGDLGVVALAAQGTAAAGKKTTSLRRRAAVHRYGRHVWKHDYGASPGGEFLSKWQRTSRAPVREATHQGP